WNHHGGAQASWLEGGCSSALHMDVRLLRQDDMGGVVGGRTLRALVAKAHRIDAGEEVLASAQKYGGDREVDLVDQPSRHVLENRGNSPAESDVLAVSRILRARQRSMNTIGNEVKRRSALHREGRTSMVCEHEDGHVVGRVVAPPSLPTVVGPGAARRREHVAAHDPGAEVVKAARGKV